VGYATTKRVYSKAGGMVLISHKQACRDLGVQPIQLRKWKKDVDKIRSYIKGLGKARSLTLLNSQKWRLDYMP
jgi:hypothetical protein